MREVRNGVRGRRIACWQGLVSRYGFDLIIEIVKDGMRQCDPIQLA
jgi:hypothetical protein